MKNYRLIIPFIICLVTTPQIFSNNNYPIILVHGFLGWGKEEVGDRNYWGGENDIEEYLIDKGYTVYSVSLGPISSTYDCAVETFYQIKGGQVDYGYNHSKEYGIERKPKGKVYKGLYPKWDENNPVHLLGYSFGGLTTRMLLHLLNSTFSIGKSDNLEESSLLGKPLEKWVKSITTMSTPHNGSTLSDIVIGSLPFTDNLLPIASLISSNYYDFDLDHWNLSKKEDETIRQYISRYTSHPAWNTKNSIAWDSSIKGAKELNDFLIIDPEVYYFSSSTVASVLDTSTGNFIPAEYISMMSYPWSWLIGRTRVDMGNGKKTDEDWFRNDGTVNTISMIRPFTGKNGPEPMQTLSKSNKIVPGMWFHIGEFPFDHKAFVGHFLNDPKKINDIMQIFENHAKRLYALP